MLNHRPLYSHAQIHDDWAPHYHRPGRPVHEDAVYAALTVDGLTVMTCRFPARSYLTVARGIYCWVLIGHSTAGSY